MCSCSADINGDDGPLKGGEVPFYHHALMLSFQDASGNDLVKGFEDDAEITTHMFPTVNPDLYKLEVIFPDGFLNPWKPDPQPGVILAERVPQLYVVTDYAEFLETGNDDYYFWLESQSVKWIMDEAERLCLPFPKMLTFELTFPNLFGDDAVHEIVTFWKEGNGPTNSCLCYRIELDGKEYTQIAHQKLNQISVATIILDR